MQVIGPTGILLSSLKSIISTQICWVFFAVPELQEFLIVSLHVLREDEVHHKGLFRSLRLLDVNADGSCDNTVISILVQVCILKPQYRYFSSDIKTTTDTE